MKDLLVKTYTNHTRVIPTWDYQFPYTFPINWLNPFVPIDVNVARINSKSFTAVVNAPKH